MLEVLQVPMLKDNYSYLLKDSETGAIAAVDPGEPDRVAIAIDAWGGRLDMVLVTHHHWDHVGGNLAFADRYGARILGSKIDRDRIPGIDIELEDGAVVELGQSRLSVIFVPGHTRGHIAYYSSPDRALFSGDVIFSLGSGLIFEGTPLEMWKSILKLRGLPDDTRIYGAHEYTLDNARFAVGFDPDNVFLASFVERAKALRAMGKPTVPSFMGEEKRANPFLRADASDLVQKYGWLDWSSDQVLGEIRRRKNVFDGLIQE
jgi:hydroxyacylglutathione hydrolase